MLFAPEKPRDFTCAMDSHFPVIGSLQTAPLHVNEVVNISEFTEELAKLLRRFRVVRVNVALADGLNDEGAAQNLTPPV